MSRKERLLSPGELVRCKDNVKEKLVLWSSFMSNFEDDCGFAETTDVLLIIRSKKPDVNVSKQTNILTPEWKNGGYFVMTPDGRSGWVGSGWVTPIDHVRKGKS